MSSSSQKREREEDARDKNRKAVSDRPKQWETVGSDDSVSESGDHDLPRKHNDNEDDSNSSGSSDESSKESTEKYKSKKQKKKEEKKDKKHKKDKKEKKEKKHKKDKKKNKEHTSSSSSSSSSSLSSVGVYAVDQNQFGKYGIIREDSFFHKQREFEKYMEEVKHMPNILDQSSKREVMTYFKDFIEDYNTATMPHEKFYNLEKWEMEDYHRSKFKDNANKRGSGEEEFSIVNDETDRRLELKRKREIEEQRQFQYLKSQMIADKDRTEHMRKQSELQTQWQLAYKQGDTATFKKLERMLAPEEMKAVQKHPWA